MKNDDFVFMKVGRHSGEDFSDILRRKRRERDKTGSIWWGYGGPTLHPVKTVRPFVADSIAANKNVQLVMQVIESNHDDIGAVAVEYSSDGINWNSMPEGIEVRSSRYALVLDEITEGSMNSVDLRNYRVAIGPSEGMVASEYLRGRVDKGCFKYSGLTNEALPPRDIREDLIATLLQPYAVMLR